MSWPLKLLPESLIYENSNRNYSRYRWTISMGQGLKENIKRRPKGQLSYVLRWQ